MTSRMANLLEIGVFEIRLSAIVLYSSYVPGRYYYQTEC